MCGCEIEKKNQTREIQVGRVVTVYSRIFRQPNIVSSGGFKIDDDDDDDAVMMVLMVWVIVISYKWLYSLFEYWWK